jgi:hypothetical protein
MNAGFVYSANRGILVRIGGEQRTLRLGKYPHRFLKKLHAIHARHALVGKQQGYAIISNFQFLQNASVPSGTPPPITRYSAPYLERKSRSIARSASESSSTLNKIGFGTMTLLRRSFGEPQTLLPRLNGYAISIHNFIFERLRLARTDRRCREREIAIKIVRLPILGATSIGYKLKG